MNLSEMKSPEKKQPWMPAEEGETGTGRTREYVETREFLKNIIDGSADAIIVTDLENRIVLFNRGAENLFGYRAEEVLGTSVLDLYPPELREKRIGWGKRLLRGEVIQNLRAQIYDSHGREVEILLSLSPLKDREGKIIGTVGVLEDITKEVRLEREALQTKTYLENLFNTANDLIYVLSPDGRLRDLNRKVEEVTGLSRERLLGRPFSEILIPPTDERFRSNLERRIQGEDVPPYEVELLGKEGKIFLEIRASLLEGVGIIGIGRDITRRKKREEEIQRLEAAVQSMREYLILTDLEGRITYTNPALLRSYGYRSTDLLQKSIALLFPPEFREKFTEKVLQKALEGGWGGEALSQRKDGGTFWIQGETSLIRDGEGKPTALVWVLGDITKRKKLERQLFLSEKLASVGLLAAGVAHEINNPLANISLYAQLLMKSLPEEDRTRQKLQVVREQADVAARIVKGLLDFSRQTRPSMDSTDVNQVIEKVLTFLRQQKSFENVKVVRDLEPDLPTVLADSDQLLQVFVNILTNALQAMPEGGELSIETKKANGIEIQISDTGRGIPEEILPRIFDPFFTTKEVGKGTGLGLSICYGIIERHNGTIEVESEVGKGTTVTIILPAGETV
jgi:two-component system NtrC family sensor kinase